MALTDRRVLRFALTVALALALAYGLGFPLPFIAPLFAVFLAAAPSPPMPPRALLILVLVMSVSLTVGVWLIPLLRYYAFSAVLLVALGVYFSMYVTLIAGKRVLGTFLTVGFTLISVAGSVDYLLATTVIQALALGIALAVICQWLTYPFLAEDEAAPPASEVPDSPDSSNWLALRAMLIVMPAYLLALTNPSQYLMTIMKSVSLGQQASVVDVRHAGRELIGSTFVGGIMAVLLWQLLSLAPTLWMYFLWMLIFALYVGAKLYGVLATRFAASFWINALVTMLILLGPAVEDSANGQAAASAFAVRFLTFLGVTFYAWLAIRLLETWRETRQRRRRRGPSSPVSAA